MLKTTLKNSQRLIETIKEKTETLAKSYFSHQSIQAILDSGGQPEDLMSRSLHLQAILDGLKTAQAELVAISLQAEALERKKSKLLYQSYQNPENQLIVEVINEDLLNLARRELDVLKKVNAILDLAERWGCGNLR